jgi:hypothetical protein
VFFLSTMSDVVTSIDLFPFCACKSKYVGRIWCKLAEEGSYHSPSVSITSTYVSTAKWQMIAAARVMIIIVVKRICISRRLIILISMTTYIILLANKVPGFNNMFRRTVFV